MTFKTSDEQVAYNQKNGCDDNEYPITQTKFRKILGTGKAHRKNKIQYPYNNIQHQKYNASGPYSNQVLIGIIVPVGCLIFCWQAVEKEMSIQLYRI